MTETDRQAEEGSWWLPVHVQAGDTLADVRERILANLRFMVESHAPSPIPRSVALRLLAEDNESVTAWTGYGAHPHPSSGAQGREGFVPRGSPATATPDPSPTGYYTFDVRAVDAQGREVPLPQARTTVAESGPERETAADEPGGRGYSVTVTTHRVSPLMCSACEREIISGTQYKRVGIGCQAFRVHDACLARVQRQITEALEESSPGTEDEPEEDAHGHD